MVEEVEHLQDAIDPRAAAEPKSPLNSHVHPMERLPYEAVARHDGAIGAQPAAILWIARITQVTTPIVGEALAGAEEIQPTQLEAIAGVPDATEHRPVALVPDSQTVLSPEIWRDRERDQLLPIGNRVRFAIPIAGQRVSPRGLPAVTEPLRHRRLQPMIIGPAGIPLDSQKAIGRIGPEADV